MTPLFLIKFNDENSSYCNQIKNIFTPFYRAPNAGGHSGTGIGLSLADKIIRLHNGTIQVNSELNKGTTFLILFPH